MKRQIVYLYLDDRNSETIRLNLFYLRLQAHRRTNLIYFSQLDLFLYILRSVESSCEEYSYSALWQGIKRQVCVRLFPHNLD